MYVPYILLHSILVVEGRKREKAFTIEIPAIEVTAASTAKGIIAVM